MHNTNWLWFLVYIRLYWLNYRKKSYQGMLFQIDFSLFFYYLYCCGDWGGEEKWCSRGIWNLSILTQSKAVGAYYQVKNFDILPTLGPWKMGSHFWCSHKSCVQKSHVDICTSSSRSLESRFRLLAPSLNLVLVVLRKLLMNVVFMK